VPKSTLLNSPDGRPRADEFDRTEVVYSHSYTGLSKEHMYPNVSGGPGFTYASTVCDTYFNSRGVPQTLPYSPGSYFYNINSVNTSPSSGLASPGSLPVNFSISTTLPGGVPKTILHAGSLTPSFSLPGAQVNNWFNNGGSTTMPYGMTIQRAIVNGLDGKITSRISGSFSLDRWEYVPDRVVGCVYGVGGYQTEYRSSYKWQLADATVCPIAADAEAYVSVAASSAWFRTRNGNVHSNGISLDGSNSNLYNLGESGYSNVASAPKLYTPPGATHSDYFVSTNTDTTNLSSKRGWYTIRDLKLGHGNVYDREKNPRDYYGDLLDKQKFGKVVKETATTLSSINLELNTIYHYTGNLTLRNTTTGVVPVS
jgi:hypothetical protein